MKIRSKTTHLYLIVTFVVSFLTFVACANNHKLKVPPLAALPQLDSEVWWQLDALRGKSVQYEQGQQPITLNINPEASTANGRSGCNRYFCNYKSNEASNGISFSEMNSTKMACPEPWMKLERQYLQTLSRVDHYRLGEYQLELLQGETVLLSFERVMNP